MTPTLGRILFASLFAILGGLLFWAFTVALLEGPPERLAVIAADAIPLSGVSNPVTSVLLNFRAYDTLLEMAVLLAALLGIWAAGPASPGFERAGIVFASLTDWLVPLLILAAGYLLWVGGHAPGGAFQAGALLAAAGVVLRLSGQADAGLPRGVWLRALAVAGLAAFVLVGLGLLVIGQGFLTYPLAHAKWLILSIETAATLAIGATLAAAYVGGRVGDEGSA
ncbi:MnhB domain-containing protein [Thioalkalicoccus limnaeus]|uniref:MnhB domain-containing protein n=1 Tax=Thioalkalicoccus limnaeus TaxID=120681 RepID=A0ABV4BIX9_9GAMM